jgi:hypothetical protein
MPNRRLTHQEVLARIAISSPDTEVIGDYMGSQTPICVRCRKCGREWKAMPHNLFKGTGCEVCAHKRTTRNQRMSMDEVQSRLSGVILLGDYRNNYTKARVSCQKCDYEWACMPKSLLAGSRCPKCISREHIDRCRSARLTQEEFVTRVQKSSPKIQIEGQYGGRRKPLAVSCKKCGNHWIAPRPWVFLKGIGCPLCSESGFRSNKPGVFYYLKVSNPYGDPLFKIGITNRSVEERFQFETGKFEILLEAKFALGINALKLEQALLKGFASYVYSGPPMLDSGNTELFTKDILNLDAASNNPHVTEMHYDYSNAG